ncbi:MAG TPA: hypothetical protein VNO33_01370, partial [Kofleriaceae bacterium]|nr:hypothetical protein [Kofleriaceae bacterium]
MAIRVSRGGRLASAALGCASVAMLGFAVACDKSKDGVPGQAEPPAAQEHRDKAAQLTAPAGLFSHIPADTPYVFASFEPV